MKYKEWLNSWLINYVRPTLKSRTYIRYSEIIRHQINPMLGEHELGELDALTIQSRITELLKCGNVKNGDGLSANSVNTVITVIKSSLKAARTIGLIDGQAIQLKRPRGAEKQIDPFSESEQRKIEKSALQDKRGKMLGIVLCLYSGLRIGELLALEWSDIDFQSGTLCVRRSCHDGRTEDGVFCRVTETPKTPSSARTIPLPTQILKLLKERREKSGNVISDKNGEPVCVRSYQRSFELLLKKLGIKRKGFHSLRHTFATRALECGMDVKTLSEILGHKNSAVTLNRYAHSMLKHKREMMNKLGTKFCDLKCSSNIAFGELNPAKTT